VIGPFALICTHRHPRLFELDDEKLPIFFEQPVDGDCGGHVGLCFENADLDIIPRRCTVEEYADVA
jgi:hypothetical protein